MSKRLKVAGALVIALALAAVTAGSIAQAAPGTAATANGENGCKLHGNGTDLKHVIYLQFDNTHLFRDRSNFASDLEQMPHLMNFLSDNGTLSDNEHTILISHTAGGIVSTETAEPPRTFFTPSARCCRPELLASWMTTSTFFAPAALNCLPAPWPATSSVWPTWTS